MSDLWLKSYSDFKGGTSKKHIFLQFCTDFFKNWILYAEFKNKTIGVEFFLRLDHYFWRYSHFCVQKNDFFWFLPQFQSVSPPTIFEIEKKFWCHFVPLITVQLFTLYFSTFQSRLVATKDFVRAFLKGPKIVKNVVFSIRLPWLREN